MHCPKCRSHKIEVVIPNFPKNLDEVERYDRKQKRASCGNCGWKGLQKELKP